ncbi:GL22708 [Drosophila persimilis]|uniref:Cell death protein rpr n=2 Tax=pseudoobscura subgroup TaxID=32358 RepID=Q2LYZ3_DROPS|nr:cell death protein rpr [Drosophila pseudoobscura]XP_002024144.1 cell death protein rpr [Drosophila persimilis]XP_017157051.1 cell death protein rpr [Drosophila miranda]EDW29542.1 GL22708 [Drosophila persimilis]
MAVAFYIPDQATLLRKAAQQEQELLRLRDSQWRFLATVVLETLRQFMDSAASQCLPRSGGGRKCGKYRKPSQ